MKKIIIFLLFYSNICFAIDLRPYQIVVTGVEPGSLFSYICLNDYACDINEIFIADEKGNVRIHCYFQTEGYIFYINNEEIKYSSCSFNSYVIENPFKKDISDAIEILKEVSSVHTFNK